MSRPDSRSASHGQDHEKECAARARGIAVPTDADPNHHLWRNGRLWWIAFTVHRGPLQERVRLSLGTEDVAEARRRRDKVFDLYEQAENCRISIRLKRPAPLPASRQRQRRGGR